MALTPIPTFPPVGSGTFNADAYAWAVFMAGTHQTELDALVVAVDADAATATTQAGIATTQAGLATTNGAAQVVLAAAQVTLATTQATAAASSAVLAGATAWVSGTTYAIGDARYSLINLQTYRRTTSGAGTTDPAADTTNWTLAVASGISSVTTVTTSTTLTSAKTLLKITPASYGVTVTLPDATTCSVDGPLHIIDNRGAYPVRVCDSTGVLKAFVFAGVVSHISLDDNSTAAGVWAIENGELVGASAQLLTTTFGRVYACVDLGSSRECLIGGTANSDIYGVVYDSSTNTFGSVTLIRTMTSGTLPAQAVLSAANQVLVVSCNNAAALEAVCLTITGTSIAVGTAATATLSANANTTAFADGCGLIAVGSSFVTSYTVVTPAAQIRALSISGTTVTIGSAAVLDGTAGGLIAASTSHVIAVSTATTHVYTKPYLVATSTLTAGTGTDTNNGTMVLNALTALGTRWAVIYRDGTTPSGGVVSLNATGNGTTTITTVATSTAGQSYSDAIVISSSKMLVMTHSKCNILTDTAGTASAGTEATTNGVAQFCLYVDGTNVVTSGGTDPPYYETWDCATASPTRSKSLGGSGFASTDVGVFAASNSVLSRSPVAVYGTVFAQTIGSGTVATATQMARVKGSEFYSIPRVTFCGYKGSDSYRGAAAASMWQTDGATVITKLECVA